MQEIFDKIDTLQLDDILMIEKYCSDKMKEINKKIKCDTLKNITENFKLKKTKKYYMVRLTSDKKCCLFDELYDILEFEMKIHNSYTNKEMYVRYETDEHILMSAVLLELSDRWFELSESDERPTSIFQLLPTESYSFAKDDIMKIIRRIQNVSYEYKQFDEIYDNLELLDAKCAKYHAKKYTVKWIDTQIKIKYSREIEKINQKRVYTEQQCKIIINDYHELDDKCDIVYDLLNDFIRYCHSNT